MTEVLRNMKSRFAVASLTAMVTLTAHAAVPAALNYQGFLTNPTTGAPITTSTGVPLTVTFKLWDALTAGNLIYSETQSVTVTNGAFNVQIGTGAVQTPPNVAIATIAFDIPYWLEITVGTGGTAQTLAPRQPLASVPYAFKAASLASGVPSNITIASGATAQIGTSDNNAVEIVTNNERVMRYEQGATSVGSMPNVIGGYTGNTVTLGAVGATIGGGGGNSRLTSPYGAIGCPSFGMCANRVTDVYGTVSGGIANLAGDDSGDPYNSPLATVSGGLKNSATATSATVSGGQENSATASAATVAGGARNSATGNNAFVAGGTDNTATGQWSFSAGRRAKALNDGAFVWADSTDADFSSTAANQYLVRANGGVRIQGPGNWDVANSEGDLRIGNDTFRLKIGLAYGGSGSGDVWIRAAGGTERVFWWTPGGFSIYTNAGKTSGVSVAAGSGTWSNLSDRNAKRDILPVDPNSVLEKLVNMPVSLWSYKTEVSGARHMGPMAQDFRKSFGLGDSDKTIATIDESGIALAAIQGLYQKLVAKDREIAAIKKKASRVDALERELAVIKAKLGMK
jgi:hypothetical protein